MRKILLAFVWLTWFLPTQGQELVVNFAFDKVCLGNTTHFISNCYIADTSGQQTDTIVSLAWDLNGDGKFNEGSDTINSVVFSSPGVHNVGLKAITRNGVVKALYKLVMVNYVMPLFESVSGCSQQPVSFSNKTLVQGDSTVYYLWKFGDGITSIAKNPRHLYADTGTYVVTLYASFITGCEDSIKHSVVVSAFPAPVIEILGDTIMRQGDSLIASLKGTYDSLIWSTGAKSYTIVVKKAGYYSVTAYKNTCSGKSGFSVTIKEPGTQPVISNIFTPNGDGHNDRWEILNLSDFKPCQVNVFDRYGTQVYSNSDYKNDWDGSYNGKQLANDTYYYFVRCYNDVSYKGNVNILK